MTKHYIATTPVTYKDELSGDTPNWPSGDMRIWPAR